MIAMANLDFSIFVKNNFNIVLNWEKAQRFNLCAFSNINLDSHC
jgi:hypothetical protein